MGRTEFHLTYLTSETNEAQLDKCDVWNVQVNAYVFPEVIQTDLKVCMF
jgi:hypothetical protein